MVLAAGLGTRMRPLTEATPKPLLKLAGRSLLDHALDRIDAAGIGNTVVNAHWFPDQVEAACAARARPPQVLREDTILETGGGVRNALPLLGPDPFLVVNGDAFWLDGPNPALENLATRFDPESMDALLLVMRAASVEGEVGRGDFRMDPMGRLLRPREREVVPYMYAGVQIIHPRLFEDAPEGAFSTNILWDRAIEAERLFGLVHDGAWFHLSTPVDLRKAEGLLAANLVKPLF
ncbi:nucleotidyltransferase family protein [Pseudoroseomonas oryzae]|uniref:Nucleotidyltransferase family protein n=2 Tax=Teichococcus oryzae TaxID=1608942 RepID=A0A5B2TL94_9PROT|nr:nucleotidyltransferase family protein [Pseudoroseomonas oryzae]